MSLFFLHQGVLTSITFFLSSGDSTGLNIDQQKAQYNKAVNNHMDSIISLQHDVHRMFFLSYFMITSVDVSHNQRPLCVMCCLTRYRLSRVLGTDLLQSQSALVRRHILVLGNLSQKMWVLSRWSVMALLMS